MPFEVIRHYKDGSTLIDEVEQRREDVESLINGIAGSMAYNLVRSEVGGGFSVSVYQDRAGSEESVRAVWEYIQQNLPGVGVPPVVIRGDAVISFSA